ncbi:MAG: amino acid racemase, partial [Anaerolineae bacterium]
PMLSMLDAVADAIHAQNLDTVGLLGTRFTMANGFYQDALGHHNINVLVPDADDQTYVNRVIYEELVAGQIRATSRQDYVDIIRRLEAQGAQGVILGCTEIPLLVSEADTDLPLFDTTAIHAEVALQYALEG